MAGSICRGAVAAPRRAILGGVTVAERHAELLHNRLAKRHRHLARGFRRAGIGAFRAYDWDIPEVRAVVDVYEPESGAAHLVVAEYERAQTDSADYLPALGTAAASAKIGRAHV